MSSLISYMGTKRGIARPVAEIAANLPDGPMLDAFSGMCAVGSEIALCRQVWTNDCLVFPALVGRTLFTSRTGPPDRNQVVEALRGDYQRNLAALQRRFADRLDLERRLIEEERVSDARHLLQVPYIANDAKLRSERTRLALNPRTFPYRLASITYAGTYFGVLQSMEIDSIRFAIDSAYRGRRISREGRSWHLLALCRAASLVNSSSGQFAEYIRPKRSNVARLVQKRKRSVWSEFLDAVSSIAPAGTKDWRSRNRSFRSDATSLLKRLDRNDLRPAIVYADPPYSKAQYSRYYHVLDVLVTYDYPPVASAGRYPPNRLQSPFGLAARVAASMRELFSACASLGAALVLSYPSNGLLIQQGTRVLPLLREYFAKADLKFSARRAHSSFGGSLAQPTVPATENIYLAIP